MELDVDEHERYFIHEDLWCDAEHAPFKEAVLLDHIERLYGWMRAPLNDTTVHSGSAGLALAALHVSSCVSDDATKSAWKKRATEKAATLPFPANPKEPLRRTTFVEGESGVLVMQMLLEDRKDAARERLLELVRRNILCPGQENVEVNDAQCELWYGRAGLLNAIQSAMQLLVDDKDLASLGAQLRDSIMIIGYHCAQYEEENKEEGDLKFPPLTYRWHKKLYLGAVHGLAGVVGTVARDVHDDQYQWKNELLQSGHFLNQIALESGNVPSSLPVKEHGDLLVQLCHGAAGVTLCHLQLWKMQRRHGKDGSSHLQAALRCGECVWRKGLLCKGVGLCHGISGNGIVLLQLYCATHDQKWLKRARRFAWFAMEACKKPNDPLVVVPDDPWGLINGIGGLVVFLSCMIHVENGGEDPWLPGWDVIRL